MIVLSLDTSSNAASLGLFKKSETSSECLYLKHWEKNRSHSEVITIYFSEALKDNNLKTEDVQLICLGKGPGSFTGIRVALNFTKTISYAHNIPVYTVNSLLPIAFNNSKLHTQLLVINNAFRNMVYGAGFSSDPFKQIIQPFAAEPINIAKHLSQFDPNNKILVLGNAFNLYKDLFTASDLERFIIDEDSQSKICAEAIFSYYLQDKSPDHKQWNEIVPLYIRGSEAEEKLKLKLSNS